jgi:SAM-dependent methyltransferase
MKKDKHWTEAMFLERPELFMPYLEERMKTARKEARAIRTVLDSHGVPKNGRILDICCGIGRHSVELTKLGYKVVGVDLSPAHIERANELAKKRGVSRRTRFLVGDMRNLSRLPLGKAKFDAAISMFTSFGYYGELADLKFFKDILEKCKRKSIIILETMNRDWLVRNYESTRIDVMGNVELHEFRKFSFEDSFQKSIWKFYKVDGEKLEHLVTIPLNHRVYSAHELVKILKGVGWNNAKAYNGLELRPLDFSDLTNRLVVVGQK